MNRAARKQRTRCSRGLTPAAARACLVLLLVLQIVYTPLHLFLEPHSDEADFCGAGAATVVATMAADGGHDDHEDNERHAAAEHKLKVLRSSRAAPMDLLVVFVAEPVIAEQDCPLPQEFESSGLSPPEISCCWRFHFRAALPVRAPSLHS